MGTIDYTLRALRDIAMELKKIRILLEVQEMKKRASEDSQDG